MSDIDRLLDAVAISLDNALYKGGFLVQNDGEARQIAKVALAAIESAGFRVVPVEPTPTMYGAALEDLVPAADAHAAWSAMLSAVPKIGGGP